MKLSVSDSNGLDTLCCTFCFVCVMLFKAYLLFELTHFSNSCIRFSRTGTVCDFNSKSWTWFRLEDKSSLVVFNSSTKLRLKNTIWKIMNIIERRVLFLRYKGLAETFPPILTNDVIILILTKKICGQSIHWGAYFSNKEECSQFKTVFLFYQNIKSKMK